MKCFAIPFSSGPHFVRTLHHKLSILGGVKMVRGAKLNLESNPVPARDVHRAQTNLLHTRTPKPHRDRARTVFECLLWRYGSAVACHRGRSSGCSRPGYGLSPLGGGCR